VVLPILLVLAGTRAFAYQNPVIFADYSDPDVVRSGAAFYLVASSFNAVPGLPILESRDLVHWTLIAYAAPRLPSPDFDRVQSGNGIWAPSIRQHGGFFWIYFGDPDRGIYMTRARDPRGPWNPLTLIKDAKGWIDPCPLWDDDGSLYLVHAWAKSRAGFNGVLSVNRLSADGRRVVDEGRVVFDGREHHPTLEGPKFYKRNGWYYIFAPAGGVKRGYQVVLRSKTVYGPYEDKVVLEQGNTPINGPHQGAWVEAADGTSWFLHFQDRGAWGRVVLLEPMTWINEWPEIGRDGHPVIAARDPLPAHEVSLQSSDPFDGSKPGLQWQWPANPKSGWATVRSGRLRLATSAEPLLQKFVGPSFTATTRVDARGLREGERAGLIIAGEESASLDLVRTSSGVDVERGALRQPGALQTYLRVEVSPQAVCRFSYSTDGKTFTRLGGAFAARPGRWIGARVGLFAGANHRGHADFEFFERTPLTVSEPATLVVAQDGSGDFRTIQAAVDALPNDDTAYRTILIRNGVYREKVLLKASHVALVGEDRAKTRIEFAELRKNWRAAHADDWGAAVINIDATDVIVANLTVHNDFGGDHDHQFAIRSMDDANRIAILHANVIADGGDTLSLWNSESGLSYYDDSYFEGYVDYVCPRGWAYITNSHFFGHNGTASIWHDGSKNEDQKFVIRHSSFDGVPGFALGRNHRDAQFYLIDDRFAATMADKPIYPSPAPDPRQWGERYYYSGDHREGGDFAWFGDNLRSAEGSPRDEDITATWAFDGQWDPATLPAVLPFAAIPRPENGWRWVDPAGVTLRWTPARNAKKEQLFFGSDPRSLAPSSPNTGPLEPGKTYYWRVDDGPVWSFRADPRTTRIALAGDSTMTEKSGYGRGLKSYVADDAAFLNAARGGRSSKSFRAEGHWQELLSQHPTHILIQFGHNDEPGKGLDRETDLPTFRANMARYVDEARAAGAKPILVTPITRRNFTGGHIRSDLTAYAEQTRAVAADKDVPLIDLHAKSIELLDRLGPSAAIAISPLKTDGTIDKTHLNAAGSALFGALVAEELRRVIPELVPHMRKVSSLPSVVPPWSVRMADSVIARTPNPLLLDIPGDTPKWDYTQGLVLLAIQRLAQRTGDERYAAYVKAYYDGMIDAEGRIRAYKLDEYSLDQINAGKTLFALYDKTHEQKYRKAIETLRQQLREQPRNPDGGFWHKKRYPRQMWLDGLYMASPFLAQYGNVFNDRAAFDDVITQFVLMEKHARDDKSGLLVHGYDDARQQKWADPVTGKSAAFWGRAMGWYAMGLVETLDYIPIDHPRRHELIEILNRFAAAIVKVQDPKTGVWWQVVDQPGREKNYLESSASSMFAFVLLKSARLGYIDASYAAIGRRAYRGVLDQFITTDANGLVSINQAVAVVGLGGDPNAEGRYRDGSYDYYVSEKTRSNDPKAIGPFIFASIEMEK
jgi:rhamnogalacturonyl hydrolase YesR/beta-xylosidase/lysophospholipase L1-like esterase